jgi:uncharacterized protein
MEISMYDLTIPPVMRSLSNLINILEKGLAHAEAEKIEPSILINSRLFPDMFPLVKQVQIASDLTRRGVARLANSEAPASPPSRLTARRKKRLSSPSAKI